MCYKLEDHQHLINQPHTYIDGHSTRQQLDLLEFEINSSDTSFTYSHRQQLRKTNQYITKKNPGKKIPDTKATKTHQIELLLDGIKLMK